MHGFSNGHFDLKGFLEREEQIRQIEWVHTQVFNEARIQTHALRWNIEAAHNDVARGELRSAEHGWRHQGRRLLARR
jgi:hypothetical protein